MTRPPTTLAIEVRRGASRRHLYLSGRLDAHQVPGFLAAAEPLGTSPPENMRNVALEEQAVEAVLAKAKVTEKETSFTELMNQQA